MTHALPLTRARRIVVKVGSALLVDQVSGQVNRAWLGTLVEDLLRLRARRQEVVLVSSGAIALGRRELKLPAGGSPDHVKKTGAGKLQETAREVGSLQVDG